MLFKKDSYEVEFFTSPKHKWLNDIEECRPQPAKNFIPSWWKDVPFKNNIGEKTVKMCPSFADIFSTGFVLPMWCDTILRRKKDNLFEWQVSNEAFQWDFHGGPQMLNYIEGFDSTKSMIFKAISPWFAKTPKGVSLYQMPMFYHFNKSWSVLPGITHTEFNYSLNQQVLFDGSESEVLIKRGEPFVWYMPFKREKFVLSSRSSTDEDDYLQEVSYNTTMSKFSGAYKLEAKKRNI
jgi:hypothetical protein